MTSARRGSAKAIVLVVLALALALGAVGAFRAGAPVAIQIETDKPGIGRSTKVSVQATTTGRGLARITLELVQDDVTMPLAEIASVPRGPLAFWGPQALSADLAAEAGTAHQPKLHEGEAILRVTAERAPGWLSHPAPSTAEIRLPVKTRPPALALLSAKHYVSQGGAEAVVYRSNGARTGVSAGDWFFPGYALGDDGERKIALFAAPYDMTNGNAIRLVVEDELGNRAELPFVEQFNARPYAVDTVTVNDSFLDRVVPGILANSPGFTDRGTRLETFLAINRDLRKANADRLRELAVGSSAERLWTGAFLALPNGKMMSPFAARRTYAYGERVIDEQFHLGFDLASTSGAPIPAAGDGVVVLAEPLGIYGNAVIIDHGWGLQSLYGHLSAIDVKAGDKIAKGAIIGKTGATGLAGGDHLHFSMLLQGLPVSPLEWWDAKWIENRIEAKLKGGG